VASVELSIDLTSLSSSTLFEGVITPAHETPPDLFWQVYAASDAGEFYRPNKRDKNPREVYTRPLIAQSLNLTINNFGLAYLLRSSLKQLLSNTIMYFIALGINAKSQADVSTDLVVTFAQQEYPVTAMCPICDALNVA